MKRIIFRVDGGAIYSIATGHITRCLKLANYIRTNYKVKIVFFMKNYIEGIKIVKQQNYKIIKLNKNISKKEEIDFILNNVMKDDIFICDIRDLNNNYIKKIKNSVKKFVLFDDLSRQDLFPDILINPTPFCYNDYNFKKFNKTKLLLGEKYFFLSDKILKNSHIRNFNKKQYKILASFGGADPCNITEFFLKNIASEINQHKISVVLGPAYSKKEYIKRKYSKIKNVKFYENIFPLDNMLLSHDIAFVCGGDTCIEAIASGLAVFIISSIDYEKKIAKEFHKEKLAYFLTDIKYIEKKKINKSYLRILENNKKLKQFSENGINFLKINRLAKIAKLII